MMVKDVMHKDPFTIESHTKCDEAVRQFLAHKVSGAPVVDGGKLVGFLSEKDLFRAMFPKYKEFYQAPESGLDYEYIEAGTRRIAERDVQSVMTSRVLTAGPETPVIKIGAQMVATGMHQVPVVEDGKVIGMVGRGDIYRAVLQRYFLENKAK